MRGKFEDITGRTFGRLTVVERVQTDNNKHPKWLCVCSCGNTVEVQAGSLKNGRTTSCGCYRKGQFVKSNTKHSLSKHPLYKVWEHIVSRCYNPRNMYYKYYGGRGITVCDEWREHPESFIEWAIKKGYEKGLQTDRIDNNLGYSPNNCRFVERHVNMNNRRNTTLLPNGIALAEACRSLGISVCEFKYGKQLNSKEYAKIRQYWVKHKKLHPAFMDACISKGVCPGRFFRPNETVEVDRI